MANDLGELRITQEYVSSLSWKEKVLLSFSISLLVANSHFMCRLLVETPSHYEIPIIIKGFQCEFNSEGVAMDEYREMSARQLRTIANAISDVELYEIFREVGNYIYSTDKFYSEGYECILLPESKIVRFHYIAELVAFDDGTEYQFSPISCQTTKPMLMKLVCESSVGKKTSHGHGKSAGARELEDLLKELESSLPDTEANRRRIRGLWRDYRASCQRDEDGPERPNAEEKE